MIKANNVYSFEFSSSKVRTRLCIIDIYQFSNKIYTLKLPPNDLTGLLTSFCSGLPCSIITIFGDEVLFCNSHNHLSINRFINIDIEESSFEKIIREILRILTD